MLCVCDSYNFGNYSVIMNIEAFKGQKSSKI